MMDLVVAMAPSVDEATMTKTFELIRPYLEVTQLHTMCLMALSGFSIENFASRVYFSFTLCLLFSDQGAGHAEEGVPRAGGAVRRRER